MTSRQGPPRVSVVVATYNHGRFLAECVESVLHQTYDNLELIVVDDGSTDETKDVVKVWQTDPRLTYIYQDNAGQAAAKNRGIRESTGRYVAFLDADDRWELNKLEAQLPLFADAAVGVVYSRARQMHEDGRPFETPVVMGGYLSPRAGRVTESLLFDNFVPYCTAVVRREALEQVSGFKEYLAMAIDWDLWLRISLHYEFAYLDAPLLQYRIHAGQMSHNSEVRMRCCDQILEEFIRDYPDAVAPAVLRKAQAYACAIRGGHFESRNRWLALKYYLRSLRLAPSQMRAYRGLVALAMGPRLHQYLRQLRRPNSYAN